MSKRLRILVVQPYLQPPGGKNMVTAWIIQALQGLHDVSLVTTRPVDLRAVNRFYGTSLRPEALTLLRVEDRLQGLWRRLPVSLNMLKNALLPRQVRHLVADYDVVISGNNEADFGTPVIQYIHYPWGARPRPDADIRWYHVGPALAGYYRVCDLIAGRTRDGVARSLALANSDWTGDVFTRHYGVPATTVYPPVPGGFPDIPWAERDNGFVCIGRFAPEKRLGLVMDIVAAVRRTLPEMRDVHLHLVGNPGDGYGQRILEGARAHSDWITVHTDLPRSEMVKLVSANRYGIHGMAEEHFGIAPAEMVRAGCIVWVPRGGGQVEIVGRDDRFLYGSAREAVDKITSTLRDSDAQVAMREHLRRQVDRFSEETFVGRIRDIVERFAAARQTGSDVAPRA